MNNRLIKSNDAGGGACTNTVDLYNPFPDGGGVALYQLNGDATDVSGNYNGTASNVTYGAGQFGQAGVFNGSSYIQASAGYPSTLGNITVSGWFNFSNSNDGWVGNNSGSLFSLGQSTTTVAGNNLVIRLAENSTNFKLNSFNNDSSITMNTASPSRGTWFHIALTYETSTNKFKVYLNGAYQGESAALTYNFQTTAFRIGSGVQNGGVFHFQGLSDQVRIFSRALRPYEVEALYTEEYCTPTIVPSEHFNTVLYTGNGTSQTITGVGFNPDMVWVKRRDASANNHILQDTIRGGGQANTLIPDRTDAQGVNGQYGYISSFGTDSFGVAAGTTSAEHTNFLNASYVAWNFKAGGAAVTNTDGTITSQVSANTEAGFSVVSYTGNGTGSSTIGHGLGDAPSIILIKGRSLASDWNFFYNIDGSSNRLYLNTTGADTDFAPMTSFSSSTINLPSFNSAGWNGASDTYIAYCFAEVEGFSNFGSYVGTGASGNTVITGFEPAFLIVKRTQGAGNWLMFDNKRNPSNPLELNLDANNSEAEENNVNYRPSFLENGFSIGGTSAGINANGETYIYMAFAADPTTIEPTLEDSFNTVLYTGNGSSQSITGVGFEPQLSWIKVRNTVNQHFLVDDVRGNFYLRTNDTAAETAVSGFNGFTSDGFDFSLGGALYNGSGLNYVAWAWKGAELPAINSNGSIPSVVSANPAAGFSIVSYTGNGSTSATIGHGLEAKPAMVITKMREQNGGSSSTSQWIIYHKNLSGNTSGDNPYSLYFNTDAELDLSAFGTYNNITTSIIPVTRQSSFSAHNNNNLSTYIAYCFAEVAGFSKFGSYAGGSTGSGNEISVGFEPAFVLVKKTDGVSGLANWWIWDNKRNPSSPYGLLPNLSNAENTLDAIRFTSTGFYFVTTNAEVNNSGSNFIYMAFANQF